MTTMGVEKKKSGVCVYVAIVDMCIVPVNGPPANLPGE